MVRGQKYEKLEKLIERLVAKPHPSNLYFNVFIHKLGKTQCWKKHICHRILVQTLHFLTALPSGQEGVKNCCKAYCLNLEKTTYDNCRKLNTICSQIDGRINYSSCMRQMNSAKILIERKEIRKILIERKEIRKKPGKKDNCLQYFKVIPHNCTAHPFCA